MNAAVIKTIAPSNDFDFVYLFLIFLFATKCNIITLPAAICITGITLDIFLNNV